MGIVMLNLFSLIILKSIYSFCIFNKFFACTCSVRVCIGHLENIGSRVMQLFQMSMPLIAQYHKCHSLILPPVLSKLSDSRWWIQIFQNSSFCLKVYSLSLATTTVGYFSWSNMLSHSFLRKWLTNFEVCITVICLLVILSSKQFVPWEKYLPNSASDSLDCCLQPRIVFWLLKNALCVLSILLFRLLKRLRGRVNKINLYCFIKDSLMKNWYFTSYFFFF